MADPALAVEPSRRWRSMPPGVRICSKFSSRDIVFPWRRDREPHGGAVFPQRESLPEGRRRRGRGLLRRRAGLHRLARRAGRGRRSRSTSAAAWCCLASSTATLTCCGPATGPTSSRCARPAPAMPRSRVPAAGSCPRCGRCAPPAKTCWWRLPCPASCAAGRRRLLRGDQERLRPRPRHRVEDAARHPPARHAPAAAHPRHLPRRARGAAGIQPRAITSRRSSRACCRRSQPRGSPTRWTSTSRTSPSPSTTWSGCSRRRGTRPAVRAHTGQLSDAGATGRGQPPRRAVLRPPRVRGRGCGRADGGAMAPWRCCCPAPGTACARVACRRSTSCAHHGVPMAVASDANPGTSPVVSLLTALHMSVVFFGLRTGRGARRRHTPCGARARAVELGQLAPGLPADFSAWDSSGRRCSATSSAACGRGPCTWRENEFER
jgi:hypothetical protein